MPKIIFRAKSLLTKPAPFLKQGSTDATKQRLPRLKRVRSEHLPGFSLTQRDIAIVAAVWEYHALTAEHIETLFFPHSVVQGKKQTNSNCQTRLRQLFHRGLLLRTEQPTAIGEPRKPLVYWLDRAGAEEIAIRRGIEFADVGWWPGRQKVGLQFLAHVLDTNTVRVHVVRSAQTHGFSVAAWRSEDMLRKAHAADRVTIVTPQGTKLETSIIPDSYFVLTIPSGGEEGLRYPCFVETDRRTVTGQAQDWRHGQHDWAKKITTYLAYIRSGKYAARYGTRQGRILTVTSGERRLANLKAITEERGGKARFWFTTIARITAGDILTDAMWSVATRNTVHPLVETRNDKPPGLAAKVSEKR
jgi:protein involved in plasmid replication-relaxation